MEIPLLTDIVIIFGLAVGVLLLFHFLSLPSVVGFLLTGILAGPYGFGLISAVHEVEVLAEVGVILLLFTIGIEFSFKKLIEIKKQVVFGGRPPGWPDNSRRILHWASARPLWPGGNFLLPWPRVLPTGFSKSHCR